jgi:uncharacterized membrane protein YhfC
MEWVVLCIAVISLVSSCFWMKNHDYGIATAGFELSALSFVIFSLMI